MFVRNGGSDVFGTEHPVPFFVIRRRSTYT